MRPPRSNSAPKGRKQHRDEHSYPEGSDAFQRWLALLRLHLPTVPEAFASLLRTVVVALFLLTFVLQPYLIPSESMEHTLLVGDFLLVNKQVFAPAGSLSRWLLPYREVARGDIVFFYHSSRRFWSSGWSDSRRPAAHRRWPCQRERRSARRALCRL
jgi:hypothetical protein